MIRKILKLFVKPFLIPFLLLVFILRVLVKIGIELSSIVLGGLILLFFGCLICTLVSQAWSSAFLLFLVDACLILVTAGTEIMDFALEAAGDKLESMFWRKILQDYAVSCMIIFKDGTEGKASTSIYTKLRYNDYMHKLPYAGADNCGGSRKMISGFMR